MIELSELLQKIEKLSERVDILETQARERDIEERAAFLQVARSIERRHGIKSPEERVRERALALQRRHESAEGA